MNRIFASLLLLASHTAFGQDILDSTIVHLETVIYFDTDESILSDDDKSEIRQLLDAASNYSDYKLWVDAYTDEVGSEAYNLELSEKRKESVVEYLLSQNVPVNFIESNFHGESMRVAPQTNNAGRQLNRRATLRLYTKKQYLYVEGTVVDEESNKGIQANILLRAIDFKMETKSDTNGQFRILSPLDSKVTIEVVAKNHFIATNTLDITKKHLDVNLKIPLPKAEIGKVFKFQNILFVGDKSIMLPDSYNALDHLKRFMVENDELCIEIAGHINHPNHSNVATNSRHFQLSVARALEVYDALIDIGVASDRMLARGYGNWKMIYAYTELESLMKYNRRVEIIITDCDSTSQIKNHQIPNREEFILADPILRHYAKFTFERDLSNFNPKIQHDLIRQIAEMEKNNLDPSKYTYREMLIALPGLPPPK